MRIRATQLSRDDISLEPSEAVIAHLKALPDKPKREKKKATLKDFVCQYYDVLKDTMIRGYTYEGLAQTLPEVGVVITAGTLRKYMAEAKRNRSEGGDASCCSTAVSDVGDKFLSQIHMPNDDLKRSAPNAVVTEQGHLSKSSVSYSQNAHFRLSPDRQASLTRRTSDDDDIEAQFSNLN